MNLLRFSFLLGAWALLLAAVSLAAAPFIEPTDGVVLFRRDRVPLDADTMVGLSQHLVVLANGQGGEDAFKRRTVAQMLALALALQPGYPEARNIMKQYAQGRQKPSGSEDPLAKARAEAWRILGWLESSAAGHDGQALAACLGDVMASAEPKHPRAKAWLEIGEHGAWSGWVQPLEAFKSSEPVAKPTVAAPVKPAAAGNPVVLAKAVASTPQQAFQKATQATELSSVPISMQASLREGYAKLEPMECFLDYTVPAPVPGAMPATPPSPPNFKATSDAIVSALGKVLEKQGRKVPSGVAVRLARVDKADFVCDRDRSYTSLSGVAAVLMNAAISGREPNATVIGEIQADGSFRLPAQFWDRLRALSKGPGGRLVLPLEAKPYLSSVLALEDPGFFFKYEVLLAANLEQLIERSATTPEPALEEITAKFLKVSSKIGTQTPTQYLANNIVRQRLDEIVKAAPFHASAEMLGIQGAGKRPSQIPRPILASELRKTIRPMAWIEKGPIENLPAKRLNDTLVGCLKDVERLERYVEMRDRDLSVQSRGLVLSIRTLARATGGRVYSFSWQVPSSHSKEYNAFVNSYNKVRTTLNRAANDDKARP